MPSVSKRRRTIQEEDEESEEEPTQTQRRRGRAPASDDESDGDEELAGGDEMEADGEEEDQTVKKMVRYALACEYQRVTIKRTGISEKVLGKQHRVFKRVFGAAQKQLKSKFGMEMVELPQREKATLKAKRAAAKASSKGGSKAATAYILVTCLPPPYRTPEILAPSLIGHSDDEAAYIGIYTVIVAIIAMSPQQVMPEARLIRALKRLNIDENTPIGKTEVVLKKMSSQGYIWKVTERQNNGDEDITYHLGPRGKIEISKPGIRDFVKEVYGDTAPDDLEKRLNRSLNMDVAKIDQVNGAADDEAEAGPSRASSSGRRRRRADDDEDDE